MSYPARILNAVVIALSSLLCGIAVADTNTTLGDRTGEGSTPFTGLAQAPEANLFTGTLTTSIPIQLPNGRGGMTPELALRYSSSGGPSPYGLGWDLPIGKIERSTKWGVPRCPAGSSGVDYHEDDFVLTLPGVAAELLNTGPPGYDKYRPRVEQSYVEAQRVDADLDGDGDNDPHWIVHDRAGIEYVFGADESSRTGTDLNVFMEEDTDGTCRFTTTWALNRIEDPNGATVDITWGNVDNVLYPSTIEYGGVGPGGAEIQHPYKVTFDFTSNPRPDVIPSYRTGALVELTLRLGTIVVETRVPTDWIIRTYTFAYDDPSDGLQSRLLSVDVTGPTGEMAYPTQQLLYTDSVAGHDTAETSLTPPVSGQNYLRAWDGSGEVYQTVMDMNGDGLLDLIRSNENAGVEWSVYLGFVDGGSFGFEAVRTPWVLPAGVALEVYLRHVKVDQDTCNNGTKCTQEDTFDITGDGIPDFVYADETLTWEVYPGRATPGSEWGFDAVKIDWPSPRAYIRRDEGGHTIQDTIDMNGDGRPDLVYVIQAPIGPATWQVYPNTGSGFDPAPVPSW